MQLQYVSNLILLKNIIDSAFLIYIMIISEIHLKHAILMPPPPPTPPHTHTLPHMHTHIHAHH